MTKKSLTSHGVSTLPARRVLLGPLYPRRWCSSRALNRSLWQHMLPSTVSSVCFPYTRYDKLFLFCMWSILKVPDQCPCTLGPFLSTAVIVWTQALEWYPTQKLQVAKGRAHQLAVQYQLQIYLHTYMNAITINKKRDHKLERSQGGLYKKVCEREGKGKWGNYINLKIKIILKIQYWQSTKWLVGWSTEPGDCREMDRSHPEKMMGAWCWMEGDFRMTHDFKSMNCLLLEFYI